MDRFVTFLCGQTEPPFPPPRILSASPAQRLCAPSFRIGLTESAGIRQRFPVLQHARIADVDPLRALQLDFTASDGDGDEASIAE